MTFTLKKIKRDKAVVGLVGLVERPTTSSDGIFQNKILVLFGGLLLLSSPNQILLPVPHPAWALVAAPRSEATNQSAPPRRPGSTGSTRTHRSSLCRRWEKLHTSLLDWPLVCAAGSSPCYELSWALESKSPFQGWTLQAFQCIYHNYLACEREWH